MAGIDDWMEKSGLKNKYESRVLSAYRNHILSNAFEHTYTLK
jgi:hypothetical protein